MAAPGDDSSFPICSLVASLDVVLGFRPVACPDSFCIFPVPAKRGDEEYEASNQRNREVNQIGWFGVEPTLFYFTTLSIGLILSGRLE